MQKIQMDGEYVWVFFRPDKYDTVQIPEPVPIAKDDFWYQLMVVLVQLFRTI